MSAPRPLVSVVVSTYCGESLLRGCLEILLGQTIASRLEIIVIDSGSPQNERAIVDDMRRTAPNIVYVRTERESLYVAWNRALHMATGDYFANFNTDDWLRHDALELFASALDEHPEADLAYAHLALTDEAQRPPRPTDRFALHPPYEPALPLFYCYGGCTQFWRRTSLERLHGYDEQLEACADLEVLIRLTAAGGTAVLVPAVLEAFFLNPHGISRATDTSEREQAILYPRARDTTPLHRMYAIDPDDPASVADGWTALGNLAYDVQVPWQDGPLRNTEFALECYARALRARPNHAPALHNRYVILLLTVGTGAAEATVAGFGGADAARIRGTDRALIHPAVQPAVSGPVFAGAVEVAAK
ncbi:MAG: glycosyltransferase [Actinomycetota bacterium]|nr:glycosyltransferase [Actinomycetota bacterium]